MYLTNRDRRAILINNGKYVTKVYSDRPGANIDLNCLFVLLIIPKSAFVLSVESVCSTFVLTIFSLP